MSEIRRTDFFNLQKQILETLFLPEWFVHTTRKDHPAYLRWSLCRKILDQQGAIRWPEQRADLPTLARIGLDSWILAAITEGDLRRLKLGSLDFHGDQSVQKKVRSRVEDPEQYEDLMVELYVGAWHLTENHSVAYLEKEGVPDFRIDIRDADFPVLIDCKRLRQRSAKRARKDVTKANTQIKNARTNVDPAYGILVLDASAGDFTKAQGDQLPDGLGPIIKAVQSSLSGQENRSVGAVVLVWDDYMVRGIPPDKTWVGFRRRYERVFHKNPLTPVPKDLRMFDGWTVEFTLHWTPRGQTDTLDRMKWIPG
jgi:hypothetical protein